MFAWISLLFSLLPWFSEGVIPDTPPCLFVLETEFFRQELVYQAFSLYQIPQGLWVPIYEDLRTKSRSVPQRMKQKTASMVPNPIEYPLQKHATWKILKIVLFTLFDEVMRDYRISSSVKIEGIFSYLVDKQVIMLKNCLGVTE